MEIKWPRCIRVIVGYMTGQMKWLCQLRPEDRNLTKSNEKIASNIGNRYDKT